MNSTVRNALGKIAVTSVSVNERPWDILIDLPGGLVIFADLELEANQDSLTDSKVAKEGEYSVGQPGRLR
ncbi:MAG: hypothetical protein AAB909_04920 [Patescibacteria group bacterium]